MSFLRPQTTVTFITSEKNELFLIFARFFVARKTPKASENGKSMLPPATLEKRGLNKYLICQNYPVSEMSQSKNAQ